MIRNLSDREMELLTKIAGSVGGAALVEQIRHSHVIDETTPTFLELKVEGGQAAQGISDGPLPGRFPVVHDGELLGEILIWMKGGWIVALEYAWVTDASPASLPDPDDVSIGESSTDLLRKAGHRRE